MEGNTVRIIECFMLKGRGLLTELQHSEHGIPPNTKLVDTETAESWIVKKRVFIGLLWVAELEPYFDCETEFEHISHSYKTEQERSMAVESERQKRENGIYWYLLAPANNQQRVKPELGSLLKISQ